METVLITGSTGFLGSHVAAAFLRAGWQVKGATRDLAKGNHLKHRFGEYGNKFQVVLVPDMAKESAYDSAVKGM